MTRVATAVRAYGPAINRYEPADPTDTHSRHGWPSAEGNRNTSSLSGCCSVRQVARSSRSGPSSVTVRGGRFVFCPLSSTVSDCLLDQQRVLPGVAPAQRDGLLWPHTGVIHARQGEDTPLKRPTREAQRTDRPVPSAGRRLQGGRLWMAEQGRRAAPASKGRDRRAPTKSAIGTQRCRARATAWIHVIMTLPRSAKPCRSARGKPVRHDVGMPEAPEVERMRRDLLSLVGLPVAAVHAADPRLILPPSSLLGRVLVDVHRHGERLALEFCDCLVLCCRLGLTGRLSDECASELTAAPYVRAVITLGSRRLMFTDRRRLGDLWVTDRRSLSDASFGVDLLDASASEFRAASSTSTRHRRAVKALMLDQRGPIAAAGNYLIDEACFTARVHPATSADLLDAPASLHLWSACRDLARRSAVGRPASLSEYIAPAGAVGRCPGQLRCCDRAGWPCTECQTTLARTRISGRGTAYCPRCQPRPAAPEAVAPLSERHSCQPGTSHTTNERARLRP